MRRDPQPFMSCQMWETKGRSAKYGQMVLPFPYNRVSFSLCLLLAGNSTFHVMHVYVHTW
jgi:hypothetical protein